MYVVYVYGGFRRRDLARAVVVVAVAPRPRTSRLAAPSTRSDLRRPSARAFEAKKPRARASPRAIDQGDVGDADERRRRRDGRARGGRARGAGAASRAPEPKYKRIDMPTQDDMIMQDFMNNCAVKTVLATVMGGFLGAAMGVFFGAFDPMTPTEGEKQTIVQQLKKAGRSTLSKSYSYAKGFAAFGALYSGSECVFEQTRAKHDIYNSAYAGCFTGGVMARSSGPQGMAMGCATMGALSVCMDKFMELH